MRYINVKDPDDIVIILLKENNTVYVKEIGKKRFYLYTEKGAPLIEEMFNKKYKPLEHKSHLPKWF